MVVVGVVLRVAGFWRVTGEDDGSAGEGLDGTGGLCKFVGIEKKVIADNWGKEKELDYGLCNC